MSSSTKLGSATMQNAQTDNIHARGDLCITVRIAATGQIHWRYEIRNTIMYNGLKALVNLIAQKSTVTASDYKVAYIRAGTGNTAPARTDLDLVTPATPQPPDAPSSDPLTLLLGDTEKYLSISNPFEMKVVATLGTDQLNGLSLTEAGLFTYGTTVATPPGSPAVYPPVPGRYPELFARQIHPVILKNNAFVIDYDWRISFTA